LKEDTMK